LLCVVVDFDPWLLGSILLGIMSFLTLLSLVATLCYIVCYRRKDEILLEPAVTVHVYLPNATYLLIYLLILFCDRHSETL